MTRKKEQYLSASYFSFLPSFSLPPFLTLTNSISLLLFLSPPSHISLSHYLSLPFYSIYRFWNPLRRDRDWLRQAKVQFITKFPLYIFIHISHLLNSVKLEININFYISVSIAILYSTIYKYNTLHHWSYLKVSSYTFFYSFHGFVISSFCSTFISPLLSLTI